MHAVVRLVGALLVLGGAALSAVAQQPDSLFFLRAWRADSAAYAQAALDSLRPAPVGKNLPTAPPQGQRLGDVVRRIDYHLTKTTAAGQMAELCQAYVDRQQFMGLVMVAYEGRPLFFEPYGQASVDFNVPHTRQTLYLLASVTKPFTAALVLRMVYKGKLKLEATVREYLPDYPSPEADNIRLHHLLYHTSGIPDFADFPTYYFGTPEQFMRTYARRRLLFRPGTRYEYSNSGYHLLGVIMEKVTGKTLSQLLQQEFFTPLGMKNTGLDEHSRPRPGRATGYFRPLAGLEYAGYWPGTVAYSAGGLYSTAEDMLRWEQALGNGQLLPAWLAKRLTTPGAGVAPGTGYAAGWMVTHLPLNRLPTESLNAPPETLPVAYHQGLLGGFSTLLVRSPTTRHTIIILSNLRETVYYHRQMAWDLLNLVLRRPAYLPRREAIYEYALAYEAKGAEAAEAAFSRAWKQPALYSADESDVNRLAYHLMGLRRDTSAAIGVFQLNAKAHPTSSMAYTRLGWACKEYALWAHAQQYYQIALRLDPYNYLARRGYAEAQKAVPRKDDSAPPPTDEFDPP